MTPRHAKRRSGQRAKRARMKLQESWGATKNLEFREQMAKYIPIAACSILYDTSLEQPRTPNEQVWVSENTQRGRRHIGGRLKRKQP